jgi:hypothetical protein
MEITELVSFYLNDNSKTLEVTFRTTLDSEEELREDKISFDEVEDFGYSFTEINEDFSSLLNEYYDEDNLEDYDESYIDEQDIISFLNEYYTIFPSKLPDSELF